MSKRPTLKKEAALALREAGFRNRDIARLLDVSDGWASSLTKEGARLSASMPFILVEPRTLRMVELYKSGKTLEEIGDDFGITRERVRQLVRGHVTRTEGGISIERQKRSLAIKEQKRQLRETRCQDMFGCDYETAMKLNCGYPLRYNNSSFASKYLDQKRTMTGIYHKAAWTLTFPQWMAAWGDKIALMGRGRFCLARLDPEKGFTVENVEAMPVQRLARDTISRTHSRRQQIQSLQEAGLNDEQIASELGLTITYLRSLAYYERRLNS